MNFLEEKANRNLSRRGFIGRLAFVTTAALTAKYLNVFSAQEAAAAEPPMLSEKDSFAKSIKYCENADKAATDKKTTCPARKAKDKASQYCHNCQLYTKVSGEGEKEVGKCMIVAGKQVKGQGWCMSWVKKP